MAREILGAQPQRVVPAPGTIRAVRPGPARVAVAQAGCGAGERKIAPGSHPPIAGIRFRTLCRGATARDWTG